MIPREDQLTAAIERARAADVRVNLGDSSRTVFVSFEYVERKAADTLGRELQELGFVCVSDRHFMDGDDQEWRFVGKE